jgi:hypothetical protein
MSLGGYPGPQCPRSFPVKMGFATPALPQGTFLPEEPFFSRGRTGATCVDPGQIPIWRPVGNELQISGNIVIYATTEEANA